MARKKKETEEVTVEETTTTTPTAEGPTMSVEEIEKQKIKLNEFVAGVKQNLNRAQRRKYKIPTTAYNVWMIAGKEPKSFGVFSYTTASAFLSIGMIKKRRKKNDVSGKRGPRCLPIFALETIDLTAVHTK